MVKVDKINIKIGDKTLALTPRQAKELRDILSEMYPESKPPTYIPIYPERWRRYWPWDYWTWSYDGTSSSTYKANDATQVTFTLK